MVTVTFEEVICRAQVKTNDRYRLVLFASADRQGELRSDYRRGADVFGWKPAFEQSIEIDDSTAPVHLVVELREKGWIGRPGRNVCSYRLDIIRDCQSTTSNLRMITSDIPSPPDISATISVTGLATNPVNTQVSNETHTPDAARPALAVPPAIGRSNMPDRSPLEDTTSVPVPPSLPTVHISSGDDPRSEPFIPSSDLSGPSMPGGPSTNQGSAAAHSLPNRATVGSNDGLLSVAQNAFDEASRDQSSIHSRPSSVLDLSTDAVPPGADGLGQAMWSGASRLDAVVRVVAIAADIHPLVKGAWSLLNVAYTLAKDERELDLKIQDLVHALDTNCEFARVLAENQLEGVAASIVANILREVLKGASLIKEYCTTRRSSFSVFKFAGSTTSARVDACLATFEVFRRDLSDHITAGVHRDLHGLQQIASTLNADLKAVKAQMDRIDKYVQTQEDEALLSQMPFAPEADRAMRSDERGCLPGTRGEIIEAIVHWAIGADVGPSQAYIRGLNPNSRVLWLCGVAGSGKSSIAISVARVLRSMGRLGAIYGFESAFQTSLNPTNLFSTIARQRAEQQSGRKRHLLTTLNSMTRDQRATVSASEQFKSFLLTPPIDNPSIQDDVVVIDAFDESGSILKRAAALLALSPESHHSFFPSDLRLIVTSRYDPDIAERLDSALQCDPPIISVLQMEDIRASDTVRDIEIYVIHMLGNVRGLETARAAGDLARLAVTAEHSFQWASTSCRYIVDVEDHDGARLPTERLQETLDTRGGLDELYLSILNQSFRLSITNTKSDGTRSLRKILGCLVCASEPLTVQTIAALASADPSFRKVEETSFHILARKLSSIITGTKDTATPLVAFHTSFTDFLADGKRSELYSVDASEMHLRLALASLATMTKRLRFNICHFPSSFLRNNEVTDLADRVKENISAELSYACRFWPVHVAAALTPASVENDLLRKSLTEFLKDKLLLLQWLEVMSLTGTRAYESLAPLSSVQTDSSDLSDLLLFITYFSVPIGLSAPHIYLSALAFTPFASMITPTKTNFPHLVRPDHPLLSWPRVRHKLEHLLEVQSVAWSPDGRWLVSGEGEKENSMTDTGGAICLWDVYLGRLMLPRVSTTSAVLSVAISLDGSLLASGHSDGTVLFWDTHTLVTQGSPLQVHSHFVRSVAFSPKGSLLASGSGDKTVALWDTVSHSMIGDRLEGHSDWVCSVAFSPDGDVLLSGSYDETVRLWDVRAHSAMGDPLKGHIDWVRCASFSPDGLLLASGSDDKTVRLWDVRSGTPVGQPLAGHGHWVRSVAFSPDGQSLASCSEDKTVQLWDVESRSSLGEPLTGHTREVNSVKFSPDGALLASGSSDKTVHIRDARVLPSNQESPATQFKIQNFATFSPDGKLLASGSDDHTIQLWDVHSVSPMGEPLKGHINEINCVAFAPNGTLLASGSDDKTVRFWDASTASAAGEPFAGHQDWVRAVAFSPDGKLLASGSDDTTVRFWDTDARSASGEPPIIIRHSQLVMSLAFSPDGFTLASGDKGGNVWLWDVQTRSRIRQALKGHSDWVRCITFSPDGTLLASGSDDKTVRIWGVGAQSAVGEPLKGHTGIVTSLAFSPDGMLLASSSWNEGVVRVWDVRAPSEVKDPVALLRHESAVYSIAFLSDSPLLSSITSGGVVRKWDSEYLLSTQTANVHGSSESRLEKNPSSSQLPDHPALGLLSPDSLVNLDDGWVVGPQGELILWIPPAVRPSLHDPREIERFGGSPHITLDFTNFVCGSDWAKCYSPPSTPSSNS